MTKKESKPKPAGKPSKNVVVDNADDADNTTSSKEQSASVWPAREQKQQSQPPAASAPKLSAKQKRKLREAMKAASAQAELQAKKVNFSVPPFFFVLIFVAITWGIPNGCQFSSNGHTE